MRTEDGDVICECLNGDSGSFGLLVDKYKAGIFALAYSKLCNFHDAEDVTQEVFIKAYKSLHTLRRWDSFFVWIRSMTINFCKDKIKSHSRRIDSEYIEEQSQSDLENISLNSYQKDQWLASHKETLALLDKALESLPETYRQVLTLHYLGGMSGERISQFLGISYANVRQRLNRAREQLREEMLTMMDQAFQQQKLSASFTFRIVEMVKKIRINPVSDVRNIPWGLSIGAGLIFVILSFGSHIQINMPDFAMGLPLPSDMKILKVGEIPVDAVRVSTISSIGNKGNGKGIIPDPKGQENAFFMAPQGEGKWVKKADMPNPRYWTNACEVNGKIYVIGGVESFPNGTRIVEEYDPETDTWIRKANMQDLINGSTCVVDGKIYMVGGAIGFNLFSTVKVYDPELDKWERKSDMPTPRALNGLSAVDGKIYAIGGWNNGYLSIVEEYDPEADTWTKKANMPFVGEVGYTTVVNNKIYVLGQVLTQGWPQPLDLIIKEVQEYDPKTDTWSRKSAMPTPRFYLANCELEGRIYAIGGIVDGINAGSVVKIYDPVTDTWTKGKDMLTPRAFFPAVTVNGRIYVFGGAKEYLDMVKREKTPPLSSVEVYDPTLEDEVVKANGKLPRTWGTLKAK